MNDDDKTTPLRMACLQGHLDVVKLLLKRGTNINIKDVYGNTPLQGASLYRHLEIVKALLEAGADVSVRTNEGKSSLNLACKYGNLKIIEALLDNGAEIEYDEAGKIIMDNLSEEVREFLYKYAERNCNIKPVKQKI